MLNDFFHWLAATVLALGYPGILLLMAVESSVLPLPSELVMPPAGYLAARGQMNPWLAIAAGTAGSVLGALVNYALAVFVGEPVLRRYGKYVLMSERSLDRTEAFFRRHGEISTFVGRLLPVIRHLISIPAGISRMALGRFVAFTALGRRALVRDPDLSRVAHRPPRGRGGHGDRAVRSPHILHVYPAGHDRAGGRLRSLAAPTAGPVNVIMSSARFLVRGQVQGVGFRWFVSRHARGLGIGGYVRNLPDGSVEVLAHAEDPAALGRLAEVLAEGPDGAVVDAVEREDRPDDGHATTRSFDIR